MAGVTGHGPLSSLSTVSKKALIKSMSETTRSPILLLSLFPAKLPEIMEINYYIEEKVTYKRLRWK